MELIDVIGAAGARISGGDPYNWKSFGPNARFLEFRDQYNNGYAHCVFDTENYTVYQIHVEVPEQDLAFLWTNPCFEIEYCKESEQLGVDVNQAWDSVEYNHVEKESLILKLLLDIGQGNYNDAIIRSIPVLDSEEIWASEAIDKKTSSPKKRIIT